MKWTIITAVILVLSAGAQAADSPIAGGGNIGLGLELGDPGTVGAVGKVWLDKEDAFQPAFKFGGGTTLLQLDYLRHDYGVVKPKRGLMPVYYGAGGNLELGNGGAVGLRGVAGLSYLFDREDTPVDIYFQLVPELWIAGGGTTRFELYGDVGSRYYF